MPTDCPQRDERLGWTGDIQVFAPAATFLYDCCALLISWLDDLAAEQREIGTVPAYVPWVQLIFPPQPAAAWGDAAVVLPWVLYERFGDREVLARQYDSMRAWVEQIATLTGDGHVWSEGFQFGDWLDPAAPPRDPGAALTDKALVATAYHAHTARLLARAAAVLGHETDRARFDELANQVTAAFNDEFVTPTGRMASDAQTAYALALRFDLLPSEPQRVRAAARLAELVRRNDYCIGTGFVGTPLVCDALVDAGLVDDAYHLLLQTACPSWLYPVTMGATTMWERWDSLLADGTINRTEMTSFNHYALGAIADFLHRVVAGLAPGAPGYRATARRPPPRRWAHPRRGGAADTVRGRERAVAAARRSARRRCRSCPPAARLGSSCPANPPPTSVRGRTASNARTARPHSTRRGRRPRTRCSASSTNRGPPASAATRRDSPAVTAS